VIPKPLRLPNTTSDLGQGIKYFLGGIEGGLGHLEEKGSKAVQRGIKSFLSFQKQANSKKLEVDENNHLIGALRENSPRDVSK
jgi:hypothetical protein